MQTALDSTVHEYASTLMSENSKVGLSIGIIHKGKIDQYHYGSISREEIQTPTDQSVYEIASITKTFVGTLLGKAINEGKIDLEEDIRHYLKGDYPNLEYQGQGIRLKDLATHRSGLPRNIPYDPTMWENPDFDQLPFDLIELEKDYTKGDWLKELKTVQLDTIPGSSFQYSNLGANLAAILLENSYQKPFETLLQEFIFEPNDMINTHLYLRDVDKKLLTKGYNHNQKPMPYTLDNTWAAGGLKSNLDDMLKYLALHLEEAQPMASLSHQKLWSTEEDYYSNGIFWQMFNNSKGSRNIFQYGGAFGYSSAITFFPELDAGFVLLSNESGPQSQDQLGNIANELVDFLVNHPTD
jgi:CubicO group peptidase (beta-lactamase class C family)